MDRHAMRFWILTCGLLALSCISACTSTPRTVVRTEIVEVKVPVVNRPPDELLADCVPKHFLRDDQMTVRELAAWAEDLAITVNADCNAQLAELRKFFAH